ncbi:hypothetical protein M3650_30730 [Paenibacillus sp. MER TA 81-3]|nr:hypothetical protein [Paenibacillus sp. MER TA 81-3]
MYNDDGTLKTAVNAHVRYDYTYTPDGKLTAKYMSESKNGTHRKSEGSRPKWFQGTQSGQGADGASGRGGQQWPSDLNDLARVKCWNISMTQMEIWPD